MASLVLYTEDDVELLVGISKNIGSQLKLAGLFKLQDLVDIDDFALVTIASGIKGLSIKRLKMYKEIAMDATEGGYVDTSIDHRKSDNPYLSR